MQLLSAFNVHLDGSVCSHMFVDGARCLSNWYPSAAKFSVVGSDPCYVCVRNYSSERSDQPCVKCESFYEFAVEGKTFETWTSS